MKEFQRVISFLLAFVMIVGLVPSMAVSAEEAEPVTVVEETAVPAAEETPEEVFEAAEALEVASVEPADGVITADVSEDVSVTAIEITAADGVDCIAPGETLQLTAVVLPENAANKSVIWSSQDESVLTVDENGLVTGIVDGCTFVNAMSSDGSITAQYEIAVFAEVIGNNNVESYTETSDVFTPGSFSTTKQVIDFLSELKEKQDGKYWSRQLSHQTLIDQVKAGLFEDAVNDIADCTSHTVACFSNEFDGRYQCNGYANYIAYILSGEIRDSSNNWYNYKLWDNVTYEKVTLEELRPGDVIYYDILWYNDKGKLQKTEHWIVVWYTDIENGKLFVAEANSPTANCVVHFGEKDDISVFENVRLISRCKNILPTFNPDNTTTLDEYLGHPDVKIGPASGKYRPTNGGSIMAWKFPWKNSTGNEDAKKWGNVSGDLRVINAVQNHVGNYWFEIEPVGSQRRFVHSSEVSFIPGSRVSFDANGGNLVDVESDYQINAYKGWHYGPLPSATKDGYVFLGWYTAKTGGTSVDAESVVSKDSDHTLYAHWDDLKPYYTKVEVKPESITEDNAIITAICHNPEGITLKHGGFQIREKNSTDITTKTDDISSSYQTKSAFNCSYNLKNEYDIALKPGTTYAYRLYVQDSSGTIYYCCEDEWHLFTTTGTAPSTPTDPDPSISAADYLADYAKKVTSINKTVMTVNGGQITAWKLPWTNKSDASLKLGTVSGSITLIREIVNHAGNTWYEYDTGTSSRGFVYYSDLSFGTFCTISPHSEPTEDNVVLYATWNNPSGMTLTHGGFSIGTSPSNLTPHREDVASGWQTAASIPCSYNLKGAYGVVLQPGTTYYYQFFIESSDGAVYRSEIDSFKTAGTVVQKHTITLDANGGSCDVKELSLLQGQQVLQLPTPIRSGYTFDGWFDKETDTQIISGNTYTIDKNMTLCARWTQNEPDHPFCTVLPHSEPTKDNVVLYSTWNNPTGMALAYGGFLLGTNTDIMEVYGYEVVPGYETAEQIPCSYDLKDECDIYLLPGTTYYYKFFVESSDGNSFFSEVKSFTTSVASDAVIDVPEYRFPGDITLPANILIAEGSSVYIPYDVTVTVPAGTELNIQGYMEVYGNLIFEDGAILTITDSVYRRLSIWWSGYLDVSGADITGVPYGAVELQLNSNAEISGIPNEMLFASIYVYSTEEVNEALALTSNYKFLLIIVDSSFTLTNSITIPANAELHIWQWDDEASVPSVVISNGVTVTNNGGFSILDGQVVVEEGATLINNDHSTVETDAELLILGEFQQNGTFKGKYYLAKEDKAYTVIDEPEFWVTEDMILTENVLVAEGTSVYIAEGANVTVPSGIELNIQGYMEVYGNLIFEDGSILTITDARYQRLCIWTGKLDVTEADISGVPYGAVELQLNSPAEVYGIPDEMLYASIYVYNTSDINAALAQASNYEILLMMVDSTFTLTNSITIPENTEWYLWKWYSDEWDNPSVTIPTGVTVTNNGWLTILEQARMVFEPGSTLINNGYAYADRFGSMLIHGTLENNGTIEESIYAETVSQEYLEGCITDAKSFERDWLHECKTTLTSDMTIDLGNGTFRMSRYGSLIVPNGVTLTLNSSVCTYTYDYGDLEIGNITVENGGKLIINDYLTTSDDAGNDLILEDGAYLEVNGWLLANGNIKIGKNAVVKVNGYWVGRAPINNGGTILPAVKEISVSADNSRVDVDAAEYITLQVSIDSRTEENLIPGAIAGATWRSSNPDIIDPKQIVDFGEGKYRAYLGGKTGTVTLTATSIDGSGKTASITLEVIGQGGCGGNHSEVIDEAVPATCTQNGLTEGRHCALCGEILVAQSIVKATGHSYTDGKCTYCGREEPQTGDLNGDGGIDSQDAAHLLWHALFPEEYPLVGNGDINGDGKVTVEDAVYVVWHTLFPGMYPIR